ncbi:MAG: DUF6089 family protein [Bacteroidetes bacterium]|jgi:hypothetical protein|nr:DUF6089 family protein [Bacteroidota bacterium]
MRLKPNILGLLVFFIGNVLFAQKTIEIGGFLGISNYLGELQQTTFEKNENNIALGIFSRYNVSKNYAIKLHFYKGEISGRDSNYEELQAIRERNLSFRSHIFELGLTHEISFVSFGKTNHRVAAPYLFFGISGFYYNPQTVYQGKWVDLQPLGTEGQNMPDSGKSRYNLWQIAIPLGIGFNINIGKKANVGFELGLRKTFTDYLDDISTEYPDIHVLESQNPMAAQLSFRTPEIKGNDVINPKGEIRGSPNQKDIYFFGGITFSTYVAEWKKSKRVYKKSNRQGRRK